MTETKPQAGSKNLPAAVQRPSIGKVFACSVLETIIGSLGLSLLAGTWFALSDGDFSAQVWICGGMGTAYILAVCILFEWSIKP